MNNKSKKDLTDYLSRSTSYGVLALFILVVAVVANSNAQSNTNSTASMVMSASSSTSGILCDFSGSEYNASTSVSETSSYAWSCSDTERSLTANGIPNHDVGIFPNQGNPNTMTVQNVSATIPLTPVATDTATELGGPRGTIAYALNGVKFDPGTGGTCDDSGSNCSGGGARQGQWSMEALGQSYFNFGEDSNNAHVQPGGTYHYHGIPEAYLAKLSEGQEAMTLVGWAADGFPVYARYGYNDPSNANSGIKVMTGSYQTQVTPDANRPDTNLYAMGAFSQDWEYVEGLGDLDECNGRVGVTPEFPNGIYHYYATDSYPYMTRCVKGEVEVRARQGGQGGQGAGGQGAGGNGPRGNGGGPPPLGGLGGQGGQRGGRGQGGPPDFSAAAQELGVSQEVLMAALGNPQLGTPGGPPPNIEAAAATLGVTVERLRSVLPPPPGVGGPPPPPAGAGQ